MARGTALNTGNSWQSRRKTGVSWKKPKSYRKTVQGGSEWRHQRPFSSSDKGMRRRGGGQVGIRTWQGWNLRMVSRGLRARDIKEAWEQRDDTHCLQPQTAVREQEICAEGRFWEADAKFLGEKNTVGRLVAGSLRPWERATGPRRHEDDPSCLSSVLPLPGHSSMTDISVRKREDVTHIQYLISH